jgi:hypothetical protein
MNPMRCPAETLANRPASHGHLSESAGLGNQMALRYSGLAAERLFG